MSDAIYRQVGANRARIAPLCDAMTERQLQEHVVAMAHALGWLVYHTYDSRRSAEGFPDLVLARKGEVLMVELKTEKGRMTEAQRTWQRHATSQLWRPSDLLSGAVEEELR